MGGLFGIVSQRDCVADLYYGTDYHSHLGTKRGGMAVRNDHGFHRAIHNIENSYFRSKFEAELHRFHGRQGIGVISDTDPQPLIIGSHLGTFGIATVGRINNMDALIGQAYKDRCHFSGTSDGINNPTEVAAMLISQEDSFESGIRRAQELIEGSCTLLLLTERGVYAARDRFGRTPLVVGRRDGATAVSSETSAFPNLDFTTDHFLGPGEVLLLTADGWEQRLPPGPDMQICSFLWVYYGYPASEYESINVEQVRYNCGAALARQDDTEVDVVAGIPDSGIGHALGYSNERKIPYNRPFVKYTPTWPRSFMPQNQAMRNLVAKMKLIPVRQLIEGRRLMLCDDSIVRGTQLKDNARSLFDIGAREVHVRLACPALIFPCKFLNFSTSRSTLDLLARKTIHLLGGDNDRDLRRYAETDSPENAALVEAIRDQLGLTSLRFQRLDDLVAAIGLPREQLCTYCWKGDCCP